MEEKDSSSMRINLLTITGAIIGVISLLAVWCITRISVPAPLIGEEANIGLNLILKPIQSSERIADILYMSGILFFIGTIIAFFSPIGGFAQISGIFLLLIGTSSDWNAWYFDLKIGPIIGLISALIVLLSILFPITISRDMNRIGITARFLTFGKYHGLIRRKLVREKGRFLPPIKRSEFLHRHRNLMISIILIVLILAFALLIIYDYYTQPYSTSEVIISNDSDQWMEFAIYLDGMEKDSAGGFSPIIKYYNLPAGTHTIGLDYGRPSGIIDQNPYNITPCDGVIDVSKTFSIGPLSTKVIDFQIDSYP